MTERGRSTLSAGGVGCPRLGMCETQNPPQCQFGSSRSASWACFHLRRLDRRLLVLTIPFNPSPYPPNAGRTIVASRRQWWSYDHRYIVGRLTTACCLAAGLRRVLLVEQQAHSTVCTSVLSSHSGHFSRRTAHYRLIVTFCGADSWHAILMRHCGITSGDIRLEPQEVAVNP